MLKTKMRSIDLAVHHSVACWLNKNEPLIGKKIRCWSQLARDNIQTVDGIKGKRAYIPGDGPQIQKSMIIGVNDPILGGNSIWISIWFGYISLHSNHLFEISDTSTSLQDKEPNEFHHLTAKNSLSVTMPEPPFI
jgi:hypothetical protein